MGARPRPRLAALFLVFLCLEPSLAAVPAGTLLGAKLREPPQAHPGRVEWGKDAKGQWFRQAEEPQASEPDTAKEPHIPPVQEQSVQTEEPATPAQEQQLGSSIRLVAGDPDEHDDDHQQGGRRKGFNVETEPICLLYWLEMIMLVFSMILCFFEHMLTAAFLTKQYEATASGDPTAEVPVRLKAVFWNQLRSMKPFNGSGEHVGTGMNIFSDFAFLTIFVLLIVMSKWHRHGKGETLYASWIHPYFLLMVIFIIIVSIDLVMKHREHAGMEHHHDAAAHGGDSTHAVDHQTHHEAKEKMEPLRPVLQKWKNKNDNVVTDVWKAGQASDGMIDVYQSFLSSLYTLFVVLFIRLVLTIISFFEVEGDTCTRKHNKGTDEDEHHHFNALVQTSTQTSTKTAAGGGDIDERSIKANNWLTVKTGFLMPHLLLYGAILARHRAISVLGDQPFATKSEVWYSHNLHKLWASSNLELYVTLAEIFIALLEVLNSLDHEILTGKTDEDQKGIDLFMFVFFGFFLVLTIAACISLVVQLKSIRFSVRQGEAREHNPHKQMWDEIDAPRPSRKSAVVPSYNPKDRERPVTFDDADE